jgi:hypothetical protein
MVSCSQLGPLLMASCRSDAMMVYEMSQRNMTTMPQLLALGSFLHTTAEVILFVVFDGPDIAERCP